MLSKQSPLQAQHLIQPSPFNQPNMAGHDRLDGLEQLLAPVAALYYLICLVGMSSLVGGMRFCIPPN
ncbi:hypothetical protein VFPPC_16161 [Pochonia chlamydosporia 170]|uniref:Uncharacterized protein n=1 Tax=Pochonia chlamydosporia 170 TaxID=1380566 RepID=A0A179FF23_METCM|nr:hypothetical protein VFPPC_16161 [Pochonia chlamydosporia 170]OAQ64124.1 hypothetical protein VFPPC_16161 [Pochonia chlamydosporia 170]